MTVMAAERQAEVNQRLLSLRGTTSQTDFGRKYFGVPLRTYQRWESTPFAKLPAAVKKLVAIYEKHGLKIG
jgi:DNA-binding transcriptional regulator YiaG